MKKTPKIEKAVAAKKSAAFREACKAFKVEYLEPYRFGWNFYPGGGHPDMEADAPLDQAIRGGAKLVFDFQTRSLRDKVPHHQTAIYKKEFIEIGAKLVIELEPEGNHFISPITIVCPLECYGLGKTSLAVHRIKELADLEPSLEKLRSLEKLEGYIKGLRIMRQKYIADYLLFIKRTNKWDFLQDGEK